MRAHAGQRAAFLAETCGDDDTLPVLTGTVDARVAGRWELGTRGSCLAARDRNACGLAVQLMTVSHGAVITAGAALPVSALVGSRPVLFASVFLALIDP